MPATRHDMLDVSVTVSTEVSAVAVAATAAAGRMRGSMCSFFAAT